MTEKEETQDSNKETGADKKNPDKSSKTISVIEEQLSVSKKEIEGDTIQIKKRISEELADIAIPLSQEEYEIERTIKNQYIDTYPEIRKEGNDTIIPVVHEVIEKRLILIEEIRLKKKVTHTMYKDKVPVKKENVTIEKKVNKDK